MIELKLQRPYIDHNGVARNNLERHYAEDAYIEAYVKENSVYKESECLTIIEITSDIKILDLFTNKVFIFDNGTLVEDKINKYKIRQIETNIVYGEAVDLVPCIYTYEATEEKVEELYDTDRIVDN